MCVWRGGGGGGGVRGACGDRTIAIYTNFCILLLMLLISINLISLTKEISTPLQKRALQNLLTEASFRKVGQTHAKWQTLEKYIHKQIRQIIEMKLYGRMAYVSFSLFFCLPFHDFLGPTALKHGCI